LASPRGFRARNPLGRSAIGWAAQAARAVVDWAASNSVRSQFPIKKFFFFFKPVL
jgi:hypothetical protein